MTEETGEYCVRCYASHDLSVCKDCVVRDLGFTQDDVAAIREVAEYVGHIVKRPRLERIADRIEALLDE